MVKFFHVQPRTARYFIFYGPSANLTWPIVNLNCTLFPSFQARCTKLHIRVPLMCFLCARLPAECVADNNLLSARNNNKTSDTAPPDPRPSS